MNTFGITEKSYNLIVEHLNSFSAIEKVLIFGSRAMGNYQNGSDIDLALYGKALTGKIIFQIKQLLNNRLPIPYHVDVIWVNQLQHKALKEHIESNGKEFINEKINQ